MCLATFAKSCEMLASEPSTSARQASSVVGGELQKGSQYGSAISARAAGLTSPGTGRVFAGTPRGPGAVLVVFCKASSSAKLDACART